MTEKELRQQLVDTALEYVGLYNGGKCPVIIQTIYNDFIDEYNGDKIANLPRKTRMAIEWAWCSCFASDIAILLEYAMTLIPIELSCCNAIRMWMAMGRWQEADDYVPQAGDYIYFDWQGKTSSDSIGYATTDHVGIVTKVENGKIYTVEGNRSSRVQERSYEIGAYCISGFGCPDYASIATESEPEHRLELIALKKGSKGEDVKALQCLLNMRLGLQADALALDGKFGSLTQAKVNQYRKQIKLQQNGECDGTVWYHLIYGG